MPRTSKFQALLLKKKGLPGGDILLTLLTDELGKVAVSAKGIKKITSRRSPHMQTGNLVNVVVHKKNDRLYLQETHLLSAFSQIKSSAQKMSNLYFFFSVVDRLLPENQKEVRVFTLVKRFLVDVSKTEHIREAMVTGYLNRLMDILGYSHEEKSLSELRLMVEELTGQKLPFFVI